MLIVLRVNTLLHIVGPDEHLGPAGHPSYATSMRPTHLTHWNPRRPGATSRTG
jgi:hypothetical protein